VELTCCAPTSRFSAPAFELIDGPFDHRFVGEERPDEVSDLIGKITERLTQAGELLSLSLTLYAHIYISIQIIKKNATKKMIFFKKNLLELKEPLQFLFS